MQAKTILKVIREDKQISLSAMAKALNIGVSRYFMIENGERPATPELAERIAVMLGVHKDILFLPQSFTVRKMSSSNDTAHPATPEAVNQ